MALNIAFENPLVDRDGKATAYFQRWLLQLLTLPGVQAFGGTYTPELNNTANVAASTAYACQFIRVGRTVTVTGKVDVDPTLTATLTQLGISLPFPSVFAEAEDCAGVAFASGVAGQGAAIRADVGNDRAEMVFISGNIANQPMYFTFTYTVMA